ncbi:hypothetical protein KHC28_01170 [Ancylobacter sonchi]|uniref:hypothetical protein n=1 Tax=Ancylobacter sonchi TaxID=1937790 RepID=UPI001BD29570|nr:hypothetical protein [Ancylobacter sonchi]MBS7532271.1 hypothetical protein [Ancylobacter sonchi]
MKGLVGCWGGNTMWRKDEMRMGLIKALSELKYEIDIVSISNIDTIKDKLRYVVSVLKVQGLVDNYYIDRFERLANDYLDDISIIDGIDNDKRIYVVNLLKGFKSLAQEC